MKPVFKILNSSFQEVNRLFNLSFKNNTGRSSYKQYFLPIVEIKDYVMIDGRIFFDQPAKNNLRIYDNMRKITTGQEGGYTTGCLLDYLIIVY